DSRTSLLEATFARGDRRLADVLEAAFHSGCRLDGWDECFDFEKWLAAFAQCGIDIGFYANRRRSFDELLPWSHLDYGVKAAYLEDECRRAVENLTTPDCRSLCSGCGASSLIGGVCFENNAGQV
ncbi:MAG: B12-binding domain-containing radical SAM protein, partial [Clostridia bacterium]|nr:B12-binding domain-containing radical SAM protein [Clostridia bacterium]